MKNEDEKMIEFLTNSGIEIKMIKINQKYVILVNKGGKKNIPKKVFDSLDIDKSTSHFFKLCKYFTKDIV